MNGIGIVCVAVEVGVVNIEVLRPGRTAEQAKSNYEWCLLHRQAFGFVFSGAQPRTIWL